jgi:protein TonB
MFEQSTLPSGPASKRLWTTGLGVTGEALLVGFAILAPMLWPQVLPRTSLITSLLPPVPQPPPKAAAERPRIASASYRPTHSLNGAIYATLSFPDKPAIIVDPPSQAEPATGVAGGVERGVPGGVEGGILDTILKAGAAPMPRPRAAETPHTTVVAAPPADVRRIKVSSGVIMAQIVHRVEPQYPPLAKQARVSGVVELVGVIGVDGRIKELRLVSGHPLLARAALDAVSQWVYTPTRLNNEAVEVIAPITVTFRLN